MPFTPDISHLREQQGGILAPDDSIMNRLAMPGCGQGQIIGLEISTEIWIGIIVTFFAALLGGGAGFGYALLSAPFLLMIGLSPPFVITANLTIGLITRLMVAWRLRYHITRHRILTLLISSVPGSIIGVITLTRVDESLIRMATGILVIVASIGLIYSTSRPEPGPQIPGGTVIAGLFAGFLGTTTSLSGVPAAIYFIRERLEPARFLADMAAFFVSVNLLALGMLMISGAFVSSALFPATLLWLPGAMIGNLVGTAIGRRLPHALFRTFTLGVVVVAGILTVITS
jgi:uncharacterized protein